MIAHHEINRLIEVAEKNTKSLIEIKETENPSQEEIIARLGDDLEFVGALSKKMSSVGGSEPSSNNQPAIDAAGSRIKNRGRGGRKTDWNGTEYKTLSQAVQAAVKHEGMEGVANFQSVLCYASSKGVERAIKNLRKRKERREKYHQEYTTMMEAARFEISKHNLDVTPGAFRGMVRLRGTVDAAVQYYKQPPEMRQSKNKTPVELNGRHYSSKVCLYADIAKRFEQSAGTVKRYAMKRGEKQAFDYYKKKHESNRQATPLPVPASV